MTIPSTFPTPPPLARGSFRPVAFLVTALVASCSYLAGKDKAASNSAEKKDKPKDSMTVAEFFQGTNVLNVHFHFQSDQWQAMEPKGGGGFFGGGRGPGRGGPGGPGGPGGFGPGMFMAPGFLKAGDQDADGKLSKKEFSELSEKWFTAWDKEKTGSLGREQVGGGLETLMQPPAGGPPGMGRPGGGGGMNLQGAEGKRNGLASAAGVEFPTAMADLELNGRMMKDVAVRYKGNGTWMGAQASGKRSLKVDLNDHVKGQKVAGMSKLNFHNNVTDVSWMNESLAYQLYRDAGVPSPRTGYAKVFVGVGEKPTEEYKGLFSMVQNIDTAFADQHFGSKKGALFKPVTPNLFAYLGADWKAYHQTYDPKTELTPEQQQRVIAFCKLVTESSDADFNSKVGDFLTLDEFASYMAVTVWISELDGILGPGQNFYLHLNPKTDKFAFIPWDLDNSFGKFGMRGTQEEREQLNVRKPWQGGNRFLERMFAVDAFMKSYLAKLEDLNKTLCLPARINHQVDTFAAAIRPSIAEESADKLKDFDKSVAGETVSGQGPGGFGGEVKPVKAFVKVRFESVRDQLAGKSSGKTLGEFGFGGPGRRGGRGGPGGGGGPGGFMARGFISALDSNQDDKLTHGEFVDGFAKWFAKWDTDSDGKLDEEQLRAGINQDLGFRPPGGGFGPP